MSQDHGISKCLGDALYRRGGEWESGLFLNIFIITSNSICHRASVEGRKQLCGG